MITMITGPMKSGKSTELFRRIDRKHIAGKKVLYIGPKKADRGFFARGISMDQLADIAAIEFSDDLSQVDLQIKVDALDMIVVDEFFMIKNCLKLCQTLPTDPKHKCDIVFGGLIADANAGMWEEAIQIFPYCDEIIKLNAVCEECGSEHANFSFLKNLKPGETLIGDSEYKALCRKCFLKRKSEKEN